MTTSTDVTEAEGEYKGGAIAGVGTHAGAHAGARAASIAAFTKALASQADVQPHEGGRSPSLPFSSTTTASLTSMAHLPE